MGELPGPEAVVGAPALLQSLRETETLHREGSSVTRVALTLDAKPPLCSASSQRHDGEEATTPPRFLQQLDDGDDEESVKKSTQEISSVVTALQSARGEGATGVVDGEVTPGAGTGVRELGEIAGAGVIGAGEEAGTSPTGAGAAEGPSIAAQLAGLMLKLQSPGNSRARVSLTCKPALALAAAGEMSSQRQIGLATETLEREPQQVGAGAITELLVRNERQGKSWIM